MKKAIVNKGFKYNGKVLEPGDEFVPEGGKWDHVILDEKNRYIHYEEEAQYECDYCDRKFDSPQGKAAHTRFCKEKE